MRRHEPFRPGDVVALREVLRERAWTTRAAVVVRDDPGLLATYTPAGSELVDPIGASGAFDRCTPHEAISWRRGTWHGTDALTLSRPGEPWSVRVMWRAGTSELACWYVNVEEPRRRVHDGFEFLDDELDIVVGRDRSVELKDEERLEHWVACGVYHPTEAAKIRVNASRALAHVKRWDAPLCDGWEHWRPDPAWGIPHLPADWHGGRLLR